MDINLTTFAVVSILTIAAGVVGLVTWRNSQDTDSVGQPISKTEPSPNRGSIDPSRFHSDRS
ncbi:MAG: hypothetical protein M3R55_04695 [Acidobacteriota bacterium]|nr:hypothetical protein [Acidobacteriota bacterium]